MGTLPPEIFECEQIGDGRCSGEDMAQLIVADHLLEQLFLAVLLSTPTILGQQYL
jgi:hypothetical protein